jgi:hypothetical protein
MTFSQPCAKTRMARKLRSKAGQTIYALRKTIVEPVNGQIKEARVPGVNYVGGSRQLRRRVGAPNPLPWQGVGARCLSCRVGG